MEDGPDLPLPCLCGVKKEEQIEISQKCTLYRTEAEAEQAEEEFQKRFPKQKTKRFGNVFCIVEGEPEQDAEE